VPAGASPPHMLLPWNAFLQCAGTSNGRRPALICRTRSRRARIVAKGWTATWGDCVDASSQPRREVWRVGDLVIDEGQQLVMRGDEVIELPKLSFDLLLALVRSAPDVVSIDSLLTRVWPGVVVSPETVVQRVKMLREALNDRAAEPRYILAIRQRGYRLVVPVSKTGGPDVLPTTPRPALETEGPSPQPAAAPGPATSRPDRRLIAILAAAALALAVALALWAVQRNATPISPTTNAQDPALRTVAVLPFKNLSTDSADAAIALGVPDIVLDRLTTVEGLTVVARDSAFRAGEDSKDPAEISQRLRAVFLVDGTVQRSGTMLRVSARLIDARATTTHRL